MATLQIREVGKIKEIKKSIAKIVGLTQCMIGQLLDITAHSRGIIMGFVEGEIIIFLLGRIEDVKVGQEVYSHMQPFTVPVGDGFLGRIVDAMAEPIDGKGVVAAGPKRVMEYADQHHVPDSVKSATVNRYPVFRPAPSVLERTPIEKPLETGNLLIDATIPIGKGQRELIVGDRMTGKTTIGIDSIINQKGKNVVCLYCCIGRSYASLQKVVETLKVNGALDYTIVVVAHAASSSGEQYICPYTAATLGEYFMDRGRDVFVVFDDMTKHAWAYRQLSLLLERPPGRNAYPGDIFYIHSQLMERAGHYSQEFQGGSMTFFPIVDTIQGDVTGYIPSNLVSMTDGQIYLNTALFNSGVRPAIDTGLSVSRIGSKAQSPAMKEVSGQLRLEYVRYNELLKITRFKSNISGDVRHRLRQGEVMAQLFSQENNRPYSFAHQIVLLYALYRTMLSALTVGEVENFKANIFEFIREDQPGLIEDIEEKRELTPRIKKNLEACFVAFFRSRERKEKVGSRGAEKERKI